MPDASDIEHLTWAIEQRAKIQHTLLALYEYLRENTPHGLPNWFQELYYDHLIAAAFCLWRAVFLADKPRRLDSVIKAQEEFLSKVLSTNAIAFQDDVRHSAWSVTFYLEGAKHRIIAAQQFCLHNVAPHDIPKEVDLGEVIPRAPPGARSLGYALRMGSRPHGNPYALQGHQAQCNAADRRSNAARKANILAAPHFCSGSEQLPQKNGSEVPHLVFPAFP